MERYRLKRNERNVSAEGHELVAEYRRTHNGQMWNGMTDQLLHEKYRDKVRHVLGYGWVLTEPRALKPGSLAYLIGFPHGPVACKVLSIDGPLDSITVKITAKGFPVYDKGAVTTYTRNCVVPRREYFNEDRNER